MHSSSVKPPSLFTLMLIFKFSWIFNYVPSPKLISGIERAFEVMDAESAKILEQKKREMAEGGGASGGGKDLLSLLSELDVILRKIRQV